MELLPRQRRIFEILSNSREKFITSDEISNYVGTSNKTVQSDIESLSAVLSSYSVKIESHRGKGYQLSFTGDDELKLINIINDLRKQEVQNTDVSLFICKLLVTPLYTTQQEMMDLILCGTGQLKEILSKAVFELSRHNLQVKSVPGSGFIVNGPELARRFCFIYHQEIISNEHDVYQRFLLNTKYNEDIYKKYNTKEIINSLEKHGLIINEKNIIFLNNYISYSHHRTHDEQSVLSTRHEFPLFRGFQFTDNVISDNTIILNTLEKRYFNIVIQFLINESSLLRDDFKLQLSQLERESLKIIDYFFNRRPNLFEDTFYDIPKLKEEITTAIILMIRKNLVGFRDTHINYTEMNRSDENIVAVEFASLLAFKIENDLRLEFYQEDIVRLAMIFNIYFYNDLWSQFKYIILYSDTSLTTAKFLKRKLKKELPYVKITEANSCIFSNLDIQKDSTLIVAENGTYFNQNKHLLKLESFSATEEITLYIKNYVLGSNNRDAVFLELFSEDRFHSQMIFERRNEVVTWICNRYDVDSDRKDIIQLNVYTREIRYIPTVYGRAAYPKIYVDNLNKPQLEVITLKEPMLWGGQEIDVLFIAMLPNSYTSLNLLGKPFNELRINLNLIQMIKRAKNFDEFKELLKKGLKI